MLGAETLCGQLRGSGGARRSSLAFLANILRALEMEGRISGPALLCMEDALTGLATSTEDRQTFMAAMSVVVEIRAALFAMWHERGGAGIPAIGGPATLRLKFAGTFSHRQAASLGRTLAVVAGGTPDALTLTRLEHGSTLIDYAVSEVLSINKLLFAVGLVLLQARVIVRRLSDLVEESRMALPGRAARREILDRPAVRHVLEPDSAAPELAKLRTALRAEGRALVEMDEPAEGGPAIRLSRWTERAGLS